MCLLFLRFCPFNVVFSSYLKEISLKLIVNIHITFNAPKLNYEVKDRLFANKLEQTSVVVIALTRTKTEAATQIICKRGSNGQKNKQMTFEI